MHPRPKVVHLTSVHTAFDVRVFHKECKSLARSGKDVVLITPHPSDRVVDSVEVKGIRSSGGRFVRMTRTAWRLYREALRQNGDVYHFHDPELIPVGLLLATRGNTVVYDLHEDAPSDILHKDYIPRRLRRPLMWCVRKLEDAACRRFSGRTRSCGCGTTASSPPAGISPPRRSTCRRAPGNSRVLRAPSEAGN